MDMNGGLSSKQIPSHEELRRSLHRCVKELANPSADGSMRDQIVRELMIISTFYNEMDAEQRNS
ncbi:hypothetical protein [Rubeoparvulum massiliense]|uniref:hypothetical protein n=1 Tax=Rubeoparvulum massiliense TaxID=1631346 RepID=UPI00065E09C3|nr:hypothetical protein [Rubeoparvulum massiliense]